MSIQEYLGDWMKVVDPYELKKIMEWLKKLNYQTLCPRIDKVFRAFELCSLKQCRVVFLSQDPYPQKGVATGLCFGNHKETPEDKLSPSLQVIKESVINFEIPHNMITFDNSLETWASQGILMLNSALTCEVNKIGSHVNEWRQFIGKFLRNLSDRYMGIVFVLFGKQAQSFEPYIKISNNDILKIEHPAYFARINKPMPNDIFTEINNILYQKYRETIKWFEEEQPVIEEDDFFWPCSL